ncbi:MAG: PspA/IM30 family protein [Melioribacteraceae bacterium]|nr:PspA/IM30 family protein [Melioribacteraceae bacterium]
MNIFQRVFKMGQAEAHSIADKLEDPIKLTEQGIRDLKNDLDGTLKAYAEVKAMAIRSRNDVNENKNKAANYEQKAMLILQKTQSGQLDAAEADRLAGEALVKKEECVQAAATAETNLKNFENNISSLDQNIKKLKNNISKYENELKTLKARAKVSAATSKLNKQMSQIDSGGTVAMLERMKEKVSQEEALAEAYGDISDANKSLDDEIDSVLSDSSSVKASSALEALKAKMNQPSA